MFNKKLLIIFFICFFLSFAVALPTDQGSPITHLIPDVNYSEVTVNSSNQSETLITDEGLIDNIEDIEHDWLSNLLWSLAGHTIDTDLDGDLNNLINWNNITVDRILFDNGAGGSSNPFITQVGNVDLLLSLSGGGQSILFDSITTGNTIYTNTQNNLHQFIGTMWANSISTNTIWFNNDGSTAGNPFITNDGGNHILIATGIGANEQSIFLDEDSGDTIFNNTQRERYSFYGTSNFRINLDQGGVVILGTIGGYLMSDNLFASPSGFTSSHDGNPSATYKLHGEDGMTLEVGGGVAKIILDSASTGKTIFTNDMFGVYEFNSGTLGGLVTLFDFTDSNAILVTEDGTYKWEFSAFNGGGWGARMMSGFGDIVFADGSGNFNSDSTMATFKSDQTGQEVRILDEAGIYGIWTDGNINVLANLTTLGGIINQQTYGENYRLGTNGIYSLGTTSSDYIGFGIDSARQGTFRTNRALQFNVQGTTVMYFSSTANSFYSHNNRFGKGTIGKDVNVTFVGENNNGFFQWMEDEDEFRFNDSVNVLGQIISNNVFIPQYIFSHTDDNIPVISADVWTNLSFSQEDDAVKFGISHAYNNPTNHTFTLNEDGVYEFKYDFDMIDFSVGASDIDVAGRLILLNGTEVFGSVFETDIIKQAVEGEVSHSFLVNVNAGDVFIFQFIAGNSNVQISTHGTYGVHPDSATISIKKVANL